MERTPRASEPELQIVPTETPAYEKTPPPDVVNDILEKIRREEAEEAERERQIDEIKRRNQK